jgi:ribose 5-phosphate isomerase A
LVHWQTPLFLLSLTQGLKLRCIPSSFQAEQLILGNNLVLDSLARVESIDVTIDGADEVDASLNLIKGGGACHVQEKIIAYSSKQLVIIADYRKASAALGENWKQGVPLEVVPPALQPVLRKLTAMGGEPKLRMGGSAKAGPVVSDNGNLIVDVNFGVVKPEDVAKLHSKLLHVPGIVDTGLFVGMACKAFFGEADGSVSTRENSNNQPQPADE